MCALDVPAGLAGAQDIESLPPEIGVHSEESAVM